MRRVIAVYDRLVRLVSSPAAAGVALVVARLALAGIFWRSGRSKLAEGSWLTLSDSTRYLFENEYSAVPLPPDKAAHLAAYSEHVFPILLTLGLATRFSAAALLIMTMVIQIFVYPDAWWSVHIVWVGLCLVLITQGAGLFSADALLGRKRAK